jgi:hypothetical protein
LIGAPARLLILRERAAAVLLLIGAIAYVVAWQIDPYVFGFLLLGLGPVQIGIALLGVLVRMTRLDRSAAAIAWVIDLLLLTMAAVAFGAVRTISWT